MNIIICIVIFVIGIFLVIKGGDIFVDASVGIAKILNVSNFIIGATIVSFATTLPEMIISLISSKKEIYEIAIGNTIGSVTMNISLVLGMSFFVAEFFISRKNIIYQSLMLIIALIVFYVGSIDGELSKIAKYLLLLIFIIFNIYNIAIGKKQKEIKTSCNINNQQNKKYILKFIFGFIIIYLGSKLLINSTTKISEIFNISERIISITLMAIGTSLPELITSVASIKRKSNDLIIGNIVGANIIDIALVVPLCSIISNKALIINNESLIIDLPICIISTLIALIPCISKQKSSKLQGKILTFLYVFYLGILVIRR